MLKVNNPKTIKQSLIFAAFFIAAGCTSGLNSQEDGSSLTVDASDVELHPYDVNTHKLNKLVCDPMGGGGNPSPQDGLIAELFYLRADQPRFQQVSQYIEEGVKSTQKLFFTDLNIPTRLFNTGFPIQTGGMIQDDSQNDLVEYFALRFKSELRLSEDEMAGEYELALLSDDGSVMKIIDADGVKQVVVNNDANHPTRMGCGDTVFFNHETSYDVEIDYYQGPRYHISLIPMWRRVDQSTVRETECGKLGNSRYFDFNNNSTPQQAYTDMLLRGWRPIAAANWQLPPMAIYNPCVQGTAPKISNFSVLDTREGIVIVSWQTDIPATAQVLVRDAQGNERMTNSDNVLRTQHQIVVSQGIEFGQTYSFQGISISADMGKSLSRVIEEYID